jgi:dynein heavy chain
MMNPECFNGLELAPGFKSPPCDKDWEFYRDYIENEFPLEHPNLFGLHANAEIGYLLSSADALFATIMEIGGAGGGGGGGSGDDGTMATIEDFESQLPENFDEITLDQRVDDRNPYVCVVLQEVARMNILLDTIRNSLADLKLGLQGALNMSDAMEDLQTALGLNKVCALWVKYSYPSLKSLGAWFQDALLRAAQLSKWTEGSACPSKTVPISIWISGLFNPMAYITAVLQVTARKEEQPLDQMEVWTDITDVVDPESLSEYSADGMYIHGLCMEGARWDTKKGMIADSIPKELHPRLPVVRIRAVMYADVDKTGIFDCPVYITTKRGDSPPFGVYCFIATLKTNQPVNKWILAGAAIMMSDDIM